MKATLKTAGGNHHITSIVQPAPKEVKREMFIANQIVLKTFVLERIKDGQAFYKEAGNHKKTKKTSKKNARSKQKI